MIHCLIGICDTALQDIGEAVVSPRDSELPVSVYGRQTDVFLATGFNMGSDPGLAKRPRELR
jgi:hypothetical protein